MGTAGRGNGTSIRIAFLGKGGVGKTTLSVSLALCLSRKEKTLLLCLDPASNLSDIFSKSISRTPKKVHKNLFAAHLDTFQEATRFLSKMASFIKVSYPEFSTLNLDKYFDALKNAPGVEEYALLLSWMEFSKYKFLVVDMPPTGYSVKLLSLPSAYRRWVEVLIKLREESSGADSVCKRLLQMKQLYHRLERFLKEFTFAVVYDTGSMSRSEANRTAKFLLGQGFKFKLLPNKHAEGVPFFDSVKFPDTYNEIGEILCRLLQYF